MTPSDIEAQNARHLLEYAHMLARYHSAPGDREATAVALLYAAIELATPGQSAQLRAAVFFDDDYADSPRTAAVCATETDGSVRQTTEGV